MRSLRELGNEVAHPGRDGPQRRGIETLAAAISKGERNSAYSYAAVCNAREMPSALFELYPQVPKKDANHWISHLALSRMASNSGDFTNATKEMTQAISGAPDQKPFSRAPGG